MGKIAVIFPGQGAQYIGMGLDFYNTYPEFKRVFDKASDVLAYNLGDIVFEGTKDILKKTEITQPAILTVSYGMYRVFQELGIRISGFAGLSLGEYTALVASNALPFEKCVDLVRHRGRYMQEAVPIGEGTMAAIIGLTGEEVEEVYKEVQGVGIVEPANYNCPGQLVIAGEVKAIEKAVEIAKEKGAKRSMVLQVSAPFHCSMLKPAGQKLSEKLKEIEFKEPNIPVIANVNGEYYGKEITENLINQVSSPVRWQQTIEKFISDGFDTFIEIGPGKALTGFNKKISKDINSYNIEKLEDIEKLKDTLTV
jgi:[acyl-carrier-protein] S-malonyltransferase